MAMTEYGASLIAKQMESLGYTVKISVFDGNDLPAKALAAGDIDALWGIIFRGSKHLTRIIIQSLQW